jgi:hypothetical protein
MALLRSCLIEVRSRGIAHARATLSDGWQDTVLSIADLVRAGAMHDVASGHCLGRAAPGPAAVAGEELGSGPSRLNGEVCRSSVS